MRVAVGFAKREERGSKECGRASSKRERASSEREGHESGRCEEKEEEEKEETELVRERDAETD